MWHSAWAIVRDAGKGFAEERAVREAAALTYYSALSLAPLLFLAAAVAGFVLGEPGALQTAVGQVTDVAGSEVGDALQAVLEAARSQRVGALSIGIALALFAASSIFSQVQAVLGKVFRIPAEERRTGASGWLIRRAVGVGSALTLAVLVMAPIAAVAVTEHLVGLVPEGLSVLRFLLALGIPVVSVLVLMAAVAFSYKALTSVRVPIRAAALGGVTTALLGLTGAWAVGVYLSRVADQGAIGALGGVAILLVFFDVLWMVYLFGAEVARACRDRLEGAAVPAAVPVAAPGPEDASGGPPAWVFGAGLLIGWLAGRRRNRG
jgi:membrane protein